MSKKWFSVSVVSWNSLSFLTEKFDGDVPESPEEIFNRTNDIKTLSACEMHVHTQDGIHGVFYFRDGVWSKEYHRPEVKDNDYHLLGSDFIG